MDLFQHVTVSASEREAGDSEDLFKKADQRYRVLRAWMPPKSGTGFIEAEWRTED
jgi:hypothetical protein